VTSAANSRNKIVEAVQLIHTSRRLVFFTGAGISTPSGVPDFRSAHSGLWEKDDPMVVASLTAFRKRPERFYAWLHPLAREIFRAQPNPAHYAIADLQKAGYGQSVVTQNIDGLHQRGGSPDVLELHGTMETITCLRCDLTYPSKDFIEPFIASRIMPTCPRCGAILKPDIVLFEEALPWETWNQAEGICEKCDLMIVVGSSLNVIPAASLPQTAAQNGAKLVVINQTPTPLDPYADVIFNEDCAEVLPEIAAQVRQPL
jgi:NAD-dependent deacetylase